MAASNLLDGFTTSVHNNAYKLFTGLPVPGSVEDKQRKLEHARLDASLRAELNPKQGETPEDHRRRLKGLSDTLLEQQRQQGQLRLELSGGPGTTSDLDIRQRLEQLGIQREAAQTQNEKDLLGAQNQAKLQLLNPVLNQELALANLDGGARESTYKFLSDAQDKNLAAQKDARSQNLIRGLFGSLVAAAAAFA